MLEIIALYFIVREVGRIANEKGYPPLPWKVTVVLAWFFAELTGMMIVQIYFPNQLLIMMLIGLCMAYLSYLLLKQYWLSLPDLNEEHDDD
jgi:hypothetical protein